MIFDKAEYRKLREYDRQKSEWAKKHDTLDGFEEWYANRELTNALLDIGSTEVVTR